MARVVTKLKCRGHAAKRAHERYGVVLERHDIRLMENQIQAGMALEFERENRRVGKYLVKTHGGVEIPVVYDRSRSIIVTVLPPEAAEVQRAYARRKCDAESDDLAGEKGANMKNLARKEAEKVVAAYEALRDMAIAILNDKGPPWGYVSRSEWARLSFDGDEAVVSHPDISMYYDSIDVDVDIESFPAKLLFMTSEELAVWKKEASEAYDVEQTKLRLLAAAEAERVERTQFDALKKKYERASEAHDERSSTEGRKTGTE